MAREPLCQRLAAIPLSRSELDLQVVDGGLVELRSPTLQQLTNRSLLGLAEVTAKKLALARVPARGKMSIVLAAPVRFIEQSHAGRKIHPR
jgi:hypothetical protein